MSNVNNNHNTIDHMRGKYIWYSNYYYSIKYYIKLVR